MKQVKRNQLVLSNSVLQLEYDKERRDTMATTARIQVRIDADTKRKAEAKLANTGLTLSDFTRMMMTNLANGQLDSVLEVANDEVLASLQEVIDDATGKKKLKRYDNFDELNHDLLN